LKFGGSLFSVKRLDGESFARGLRWLDPYSPLRGCAELAALATSKILRRRPPPNFKTGSNGNPTARNLGMIVKSIAEDLGIKPRAEVVAGRC
jgi:hypothetical protein